MSKDRGNTFNYGEAIRCGFEYLLEKFPEAFVIGQGLWSPWYVGNSMTDLDKKFGTDRIIDTPVSESACTGAAVGASLCGMKPIVVHPRMDFMLYAVDAVVNQAAKWSQMFGGQAHPCVTIRGIINRGGEQGAQHSQALHNWFAHVPGLRVVMPASVSDARDLLIASVLCPDPVMYIDDRWLYDLEDDLGEIQEFDLAKLSPKVSHTGSDITLVGAGHAAHLCNNVAYSLSSQGLSVEVIDVRILNPLNHQIIVNSVRKTKRILVVDIGWLSCGFSAELLSIVCENLEPSEFLSKPARIALPNAPAPTATNLELEYYLNEEKIINKLLKIVN